MDKKMGKKKNYKIYKVENPIYMNMDEIEKKYWGNALVMTNMRFTPKGEPYKLIGGKVQYYAKYMNPLYKIAFGKIESNNDDDLGECGITYVGDMGHLLI